MRHHLTPLIPAFRMAKHFLVFIDGRWQRTNRLPLAKVAPPEPHEIRWRIRGWDYVVCARKRIWRLPHTNGRGVQKTWKEVLIQERRVGYKGIDLWRDGVCCYFSLRQLRGLLVRQQPHAEEAETPVIEALR